MTSDGNWLSRAADRVHTAFSSRASPSEGWLRALYPQHFTNADHIRNAIRLYGDGWAMSVEPEILPPPADPADAVLTIKTFSGDGPNDGGPHWHKLAVLSANVGQKYLNLPAPTKSFFTYIPVRNTQNAGPRTTKLTARRLSESLRIYKLTAGRIEAGYPGGEGAALGRTELLARIRTACGLGDPATTATPSDGRAIFFYPDGFCLLGTLSIPGTPTRLDGWFKVTTRAMAVPGAEATDMERGLCLCLDQDLPGNSGANGYVDRWQRAFASLQAMVSSAAFSRPQWLTVGSLGDAGLETLFWPGKTGSTDYFEREPNGPLTMEGSFARLYLCPNGLSFDLSRMKVEEKGNGIVFETVDPAGSLARTCPSLIYSFKQEPEEETLKILGNRRDRAKPCDGNPRAIELGIPLLETAQTLRREAGMAEGGNPLGSDHVGALWTFTQLDNGLLHWPFPDATAEGLSNLLSPIAKAEGAAVPVRGSAASGAILLGNRPDLRGFDPRLRRWSLSLSQCQDVAFSLTFARSGAGYILDEASVMIGEHEMALEGAVQVIPFRQTPERLLPDHDERALRTVSLRGVTPGLLQGLEERVWDEAADKVQARLIVEDLVLRPKGGISSGKVRMHIRLPITNEQEVDCIRPWVWTRHDRLPMVQALPTAQAGAAVSLPSGIRQLAAFCRTKGNNKLTYHFADALDMTKMAPVLRLDADAPYAAPEGDGLYVDEIGMAALTLPSLSVFPGARDRGDAVLSDRLFEPDAVSPKTWLWPLGNQTSPFAVELRWDLALRDEFHAFAAIQPGKAGDAKEEEDREINFSVDRFEPLDTNGPQAIDGSGRRRESWRRVWVLRNRQAALAATDGRALVVRKAGTFHVANMVADGPDMRSPASVTLQLETVDGNIGSVTVEPLGQMSGLPSAGDLCGFTGGYDGTRFAHGTAGLRLGSGLDPTFVDQRGLETKGVVHHGAFVSRTCGGVRLFSTVKPWAALQSRAHFWFSDVPERLEPIADAIALADRKHDHLQGYRWAIEDEDRRDARVSLWGCLSFRPTTLAGVSCTETGLGITLDGVVEVDRGPDRPGMPQTIPDAAATLALGTAESPQLDFGETLILSLVDSGSDMAARLEIRPDGSATLHARLLDQWIDVNLSTTTQVGFPLAFKFDDQSPVTNGLKLSKAIVQLDNPAGPILRLTYTFAFSAHETTLTGSILVDLVKSEISVEPGTTLHFAGTQLILAPSEEVFSGRSFALAWQETDVAEVEIASGLFAGAKVKAYGGRLAVTLDRGLVARSDFVFDHHVHLQARIEGQERAFRIIGDRGQNRLYGKHGTVALRSDHGVSVTWLGERLGSLTNVSASLAAHVTHRSTAGTMSLVQYVMLTNAAGDLTLDVDAVSICDDGARTWLVQLRGSVFSGTKLPDLNVAQRMRARANVSRAMAAGDGWASDLLPNGGAAIGGDLNFPTLPSGWTVKETISLSPAATKLMTTASSYADVLAAFAKIQSSMLLAAPYTLPEAASAGEWRLLAPDISHASFVEIDRVSINDESAIPDDAQLVKWARNLIAAKAAWADCGLLEICPRGDPMPAYHVVDMRKDESGVRSRSRASASPWALREQRPIVVDPRKVRLPTGAPEMLGGYRPVHITALALAYEKASGVPLLAANAIERVWSLDRAAQEASGYSQDADYWLADRDATAFRSAESIGGDARLAATVPPAIDELRAAGSLYPVAGQLPCKVEKLDWYAQSVRPNPNIVREIAPRAGVLAATRMGVSAAVFSAPEGSARAFAPEVPWHARMPRPPLLGLNDRPRADEFSQPPFAISGRPQFRLFGPRAAPPSRLGSRPGRERKPLATTSVLVELVHPDFGVIDRDWDGVLSLKVIEGDGLTLDLEAIVVEIGGLQFRGRPDGSMESANCFRLQHEDEAAANVTLGEYFAKLPASTSAVFEFKITVREGKRSIARFAGFDLPVATRKVARLELPRFFRFEDPEYNDLLERRVLVHKDGNVMVAVDRLKVRPGGKVVLVSSAHVSVTLRRMRDKVSEDLEVPIPLADGTGVVWIVDCQDLKKAASGKPLDVETRDTLAIEVGTQLRFLIDVVEEQPFAPNQAAFAIHDSVLAAGGVSIGYLAPLYAEAPEPAMIELVDPLDLLDGVARYRSSYNWRLFAEAMRVAQYRLQKIGGSGAMSLSEDVAVSPLTPGEAMSDAIEHPAGLFTHAETQIL